MEISWPRWFLGILPVGIILLGSLPLLVYLIYPPEVRSSREVPAWAEGELRDYPESHFDPMIPVGTGVHPFA
jgi:di/tricarboxylate transporter